MRAAPEMGAGRAVTVDGRRRPMVVLATTGGYLCTVPVANWLTERYSEVPVAPGLMAPAGVYAVGLALVLRDATREVAGRAATVAAMAAGVALSYALGDDRLATASAAAFALSESLDAGVYESLRARGLTVALVASNVVGLTADSCTFLALAMGSLHYLPGQLIGKVWMTAVAVAILSAARRFRPRGRRGANAIPTTSTTRIQP